MSAYTLHMPEENGAKRWLLAALAVCAAHAAIISALAMWHARAPDVESRVIPAIVVSLVPVPGTSPETQDQDVPAGPDMQQSVAVPPTPPQQTEMKPVETPVPTPPPAPQQGEVTLPKVEEAQKPVENPAPPQPQQQATEEVPETTALPKADTVGPQFTQAASNLYDARVAGHLKSFVRYPSEARGASGTVVVRFEINPTGDVLHSEVQRSSGNRILDQEALETLQRASPFPPFPAGKLKPKESYIVPIQFYR